METNADRPTRGERGALTFARAFLLVKRADGAKRLRPRVQRGDNGGKRAVVISASPVTPPAAGRGPTRARPFPALVAERRVLNRPGSDKETLHVELDVTGGEVPFVAGDSVGLFAPAPPEAVERLLSRLGLSGSEPVVVGAAGSPTFELREAFSTKLAIERASARFVRALAASLANDPAAEAARAHLEAVLADDARRDEYLAHRDYADVLDDVAALGAPTHRFEPQAFASLVNAAQARLYSVASSPVVSPHRIELVVSVVRFAVGGAPRAGVASGFLADRAIPGESRVPLYVQPARHFRLAPPDRDVVMIGPGTGLAPFRAFLAEREATAATGQSWLFFGERRRAFDYLYEHELERHRARGVRLSLAFSRDQAHKYYVQHAMREAGADLYRFIEAGAYVYVCGDAKHMAKSVHAELVRLATEHGGKTADEAERWLSVTLGKEERRYQRDVY